MNDLVNQWVAEEDIHTLFGVNPSDVRRDLALVNLLHEDENACKTENGERYWNVQVLVNWFSHWEVVPEKYRDTMQLCRHILNVCHQLDYEGKFFQSPEFKKTFQQIAGQLESVEEIDQTRMALIFLEKQDLDRKVMRVFYKIATFDVLDQKELNLSTDLVDRRSRIKRI